MRLKMAVSLDGRTALSNGESQWITGPAAREDVHRWRARASAILTGSGTLLADNPSLTARVPAVEAQPLRIIVDSHWQTPASARIFDSPGKILVAGCDANTIPAALDQSAAELLKLDGSKKGVDLHGLLAELAKLEINELHTECGPKLAGSLVQEKLVDEILVYLAPKVMGNDARGMFALEEIIEMSGIPEFRFTDVSMVGDDLRVMLEPDWN